MKTLSILLLMVCVAVSGVSCIYTQVKTPLDTDLWGNKLGDKQGESSYQSILWLFAWGDAGTEAAAKDGGINTLNHFDQEVLSILFGLYYRQKTIVYGE